MYLTQSLHRIVQQCPDGLLTVFGDRQRSAAQSADRIARLAAALQKLGVQRDDRVGFLGLNGDRFHEYLFAVPWADAAVNPINIRWSPAEIAYSLVDSGTRMLFVDDAFAPMLPAIRAAGAELVAVVHCGEAPTPEGLLDYEQLIADSEPIADCRRGGDALFGVFYTGGTTGHPKGVMLSHDNVIISALGCLAADYCVTHRGRMLHAAPMFHLAAIASWIITGIAGSTHVFVPMFSPAGVAQAISDHQVTDTVLVPTMIQMLVDDPHTAECDLTSLKHISYGASPMSEAVLARAQSALPSAGFGQAYGMTELGPAATYLSPEDHADPTRLRSAGRALPHVEVRIVDTDDRELPRGEIGEIVARGDNVMRGYWNRPEETAAALRDGWMHTGDMGRMDEDGFVFVVDRLKDMIISGGENVYSAEVENALAKHPAVAAAAVIGLSDARWGERVHAVVVLKPGNSASEDVLQEHCRTLIAGYKIPRSVDFAAELPMSGAGKILKRELRERYRALEGVV
ncbi:MAG: long-chain fatty acid--CoA ligase [Mycolicibacterium fortuitum]|uniref:acyl-CoA synthetase n=1 Tax=Mycolicibacterium fortuitum TaxID=1766 RepID=UPI0022BA6AF4|nr:long-chain fatty acid--CoA ligase [Mycolicibacterium fortuitum]WAY19763.1 long-chain fatty acid--CoA ligase [Mycolicibacterium fortuitum]